MRNLLLADTPTCFRRWPERRHRLSVDWEDSRGRLWKDSIPRENPLRLGACARTRASNRFVQTVVLAFNFPVLPRSNQQVICPPPVTLFPFGRTRGWRGKKRRPASPVVKPGRHQDRYLPQAGRSFRCDARFMFSATVAAVGLALLAVPETRAESPSGAGSGNVSYGHMDPSRAEYRLLSSLGRARRRVACVVVSVMHRTPRR